MSNIAKYDGQLNVLLVGNNPIDLSRTQEGLGQIQNHQVTIETAFDLTSIFDRLSRFRPNFILLDDNLGSTGLRLIVQALQVHRKTKGIPVTVLKNSNYIDTINAGVMNYVLKQSITGDVLYTAFMNSLKFKRTQQYLQQAYRKRKGQFLRMVKFQD
ncbi:MAG: response regulator [Cyclobacteriaceae bacterium]|nr:response regulator [Cyclobacteriaceae bacterium]